MYYIPTVISIIEVLLVIVPALLSVAYVTVAERKTMASMQRRLGPNAVGWYGLLQAFADALKLLLKEYVAPTQANIVLFFLGPVITLVFALLGYGVIPWSVILGLWHCGVKQSNSGNILILILLNSVGNNRSGWANSSGKVTIYKLIEKAMDYCGSKSNLIKFVKEQRVNGCWCIILLWLMHLRCTLNSWKITYIIKTLSKQFYIRFLSDSSSVVSRYSLWFKRGNNLKATKSLLPAVLPCLKQTGLVLNIHSKSRPFLSHIGLINSIKQRTYSSAIPPRSRARGPGPGSKDEEIF